LPNAGECIQQRYPQIEIEKTICRLASLHAFIQAFAS
jgi:hypothetical protein